mgnify:FL=1
MLAGFLCLTKPAFMRRPWRITPCPAVPGWAFLCFVGIISTVSSSFAIRPPEPVCACRLGSSRCGSIYLLVALPTAIAVGSLCACSLFFYAFPRLLPWARSVRAGYLCMLFPVSAGLAWICSLFVRVCSGLAQHHIECHHEAEAHHKCYGGAV